VKPVSAATIITKLIFSLGLLFLFLVGTAVAPSPLFAAPKNAPNKNDQVRPLPNFPYQDGWLGADDAYSISMGGNQSLWLFGDTFVAGRDTKLRSQYQVMVRNSIGISSCPPGGPCTIQYFWKNPYTPHARSFFDTGTDDLWYWPLDAYLDGKQLFISLLAVRNQPRSSAPEAFGFEIAGTDMATVSNPHDPPEKWQISIQKLTGSHFWPGPSIIPHGSYVLWYTQVSEGEGKGYMTVLRLPKSKMANPSSAWEYLKKDGSWGAGLPSDDAMHVIDQAISEMSVRYHPPIRKWIAIVPGPGFPTPEVDARTSDSPIGPWSKPQKIFEFPELKPGHPGYDKDTFCYATKEHIEFTVKKIALTYACNSMVLAKTVANMDIYRPQVVILDLPH
jgi:Domain of unknown function (DUF4185)